MGIVKTIAIIIIVVLMAIWGYLMGSCLIDLLNEPDDMIETMQWPVYRDWRFHDPIQIVAVDNHYAEHVVFPDDPRHSVPHTVPETAEERVDNNFARMEMHNDDPQNVHNHTILIHIGRKFARLEELDRTGRQWTQSFGENATEYRLESVVREIREYIATAPADRKMKVEVFITEVNKGGTILLHNQTVKEGWLFSMIWDRINSVDNLAIQANMREMFITQILEAVQRRGNEFIDIFQDMVFGREHRQEGEYRTVCLNGRVGQMMATFTNLDADALLAEPILDEKEISNAAYSRAHDIFAAALEADSNMRDLYNKDEYDLSPDERRRLEKFVKKIRKDIDRNLRSTYIDMLSADKLQEVIANAQAGIS